MITRAKTIALLEGVNPPSYQEHAAPLSSWLEWNSVAAALSEHGEQVAADFGEAVVARATTVAAGRAEWETDERLVADFVATGFDLEEERERRETTINTDTAAIIMRKRCFHAVRTWFELRRPARAADPLAEQRRQEKARFVASHEASAAPAFDTPAEKVAAAAALACAAVMGFSETKQVVAADVLYTVYPDALALAPQLIVPEVIAGASTTSGVQ